METKLRNSISYRSLSFMSSVSAKQKRREKQQHQKRMLSMSDQGTRSSSAYASAARSTSLLASSASNITKESILQEKLKVCDDLASALQHLHRRNILCRHLKPESCGFTADDGASLKLFDLGSAVCLNNLAPYYADGNSSGLYDLRNIPLVRSSLEPSSEQDDGKNKKTKQIIHDAALYVDLPKLAGSHTGSGSWESPCGLSADISSWSMVAYEVLSGKEPFRDVMIHEYIDQVVVRGVQRPRIDIKWCPHEDVATLLRRCWDHDQLKRPKIDEILSVLARHI